jgi:hypothetical protein
MPVGKVNVWPLQVKLAPMFERGVDWIVDFYMKVKILLVIFWRY